MKNINLYGNIVKDTIFSVDCLKIGAPNASIKSEVRYGGLINIVRAINLYTNYNIKLFSSGSFSMEKDLINLYKVNSCFNYTDQVARATIIEKHFEKTSIVDWGNQKIPFIPEESDWNHISYLDKIKNISEAKNLTHIDSADLCSVDINDSIIEIIKRVNYLIISDHEFEPLKKYLIGLPKKALIVHSINGCEIYSKNLNKSFVNNNILNNIKIVGAGDTFIGIFIQNSLYYKDIVHILNETNKLTPIFLEKINLYE